jgi:hypothetical protein
MTTQNTTAEMLITAEEEAFNLPDAEESEREDFVRRDEYLEALEAIEQREELIEALSHVVVSEAVRRECEEEMRQAERRGWKF